MVYLELVDFVPEATFAPPPRAQREEEPEPIEETA
jgi:hypothetical protein